jgi:outer membrane receptor protein involved in Fe transport
VRRLSVLVALFTATDALIGALLVLLGHVGANPSPNRAYTLAIHLLNYLPWQRVTVFGRYSDAPSSLDQRGGILSPSNTQNINYRTQSATLGTTQSLTPAFTNEFHFNYSRSRTHSFVNIDNFGGATPPPDSVLYPYPSFAPPDTELLFYAGSGLPILLAGSLGNNLQQQYNATDNLSGIQGAHQLKFGLDYRRLRPELGLAPYTVQYIFASLPNVLANTVPEALINSRTADVQLIFPNWSLFAQDTWKATRTLTITYGLRWEYNAAPSAGNGNLPFTVTQVNNLVAWQPFPNLILRAGAGIFYDLGYGEIANERVPSRTFRAKQFSAPHSL